jgi:hypothetical protein
MIAQDRRQARCARCTARGTPYGMSWQRSGTSPDPKFAGAAAIPQDLPVEMSGEGSPTATIRAATEHSICAAPVSLT